MARDGRAGRVRFGNGFGNPHAARARDSSGRGRAPRSRRRAAHARRRIGERPGCARRDAARHGGLELASLRPRRGAPRRAPPHRIVHHRPVAHVGIPAGGRHARGAAAFFPAWNAGRGHDVERHRGTVRWRAPDGSPADFRTRGARASPGQSPLPLRGAIVRRVRQVAALRQPAGDPRRVERELRAPSPLVSQLRVLGRPGPRLGPQGGPRLAGDLPLQPGPRRSRAGADHRRGA